jgi:hypothetical protein
VDVIEATRPHVLAPLLAESGYKQASKHQPSKSSKEALLHAVPLSKLVQSQFHKFTIYYNTVW